MADTSLTLWVNGERHRSTARTLADLLAELNLAEAKVATAIDGAFVAATQRQGTLLCEGARVEIVAPRQGG